MLLNLAILRCTLHAATTRLLRALAMLGCLCPRCTSGPFLAHLSYEKPSPQKTQSFLCTFAVIALFCMRQEKKINQAKKPDQDGQIKSIILLFFVVFLLFSSFGGLLQCGASFSQSYSFSAVLVI